ncbi:hypothetical protein JCM10295v2_004617 [Rhodotorula toruloides]
MSMQPTNHFTQAPHKLLSVPGPVEVSDEVLYANAHPSMSHVSPAFAPVFGDCLRMLRKLLYTEKGQPFIVAGSGTLGWDFVAANLIERDQKALVLNTGYFGDAFADCLETYGAKVDQVGAPVGGRPTMQQVEEALKKEKYAVLTFTHVDTSTGVLSDAKAISETVRRVSPDTLIVLDGVCAVASEEIRMDEWQIDVVVGASQKGISVPPGLSITALSQKALQVLENRKTPVSSYFANYKRWLPVMESYEKGTPAYFATPSVNLVYALEASLKTIVAGPVSLEDRFRMHKEAAQKFRDATLKLGFKLVATEEGGAANGMTALYVPEDVQPPALIDALAERGIVIAGGLHKDIKTKYIRFGHMGVSVVERPSDATKILNALQESLAAVAPATSAAAAADRSTLPTLLHRTASRRSAAALSVLDATSCHDIAAQEGEEGVWGEEEASLAYCAILRDATAYDNVVLCRTLLPYTLGELYRVVEISDAGILVQFAAAIMRRPRLIREVRRVLLSDDEAVDAGRPYRPLALSCGIGRVEDLLRLAIGLETPSIVDVYFVRPILQRDSCQDRVWTRLDTVALSIARNNLASLSNLQRLVFRLASHDLPVDTLNLDPRVSVPARSLRLRSFAIEEHARIGCDIRFLFAVLATDCMRTVKLEGFAAYPNLMHDIALLPPSVDHLDLKLGNSCPYNDRITEHP